MEAVVTLSYGNRYLLKCADGTTCEAIAKGNLRLKGFRTTNPVAVGDKVEIEVRQGGQPSFIQRILPRRNYIIRRASNLSKESHILAANIDCCLLVCTVARPETSTTFIDRFLATAEAYRVPVELLFNKTDDIDEYEQQYMQQLAAVYRDIGYAVYPVSAARGDGITALQRRMQGQVTLVSGHSGVGKSTLINALVPGVSLRTSAISKHFLTGVHTTTYSEMIPLDLPGGGFLIDTPGIKGFGTIEMADGDASHYFREIFALSPHCRFSDCTHTHEPGCAVLSAVEKGTISSSRYGSYLSILGDGREDKYRPEY